MVYASRKKNESCQMLLLLLLLVGLSFGAVLSARVLPSALWIAQEHYGCSRHPLRQWQLQKSSSTKAALSNSKLMVLRCN